MNIYDTTLAHPKTGYIVGLIDYLDPTHSAATACGSETERNDAIHKLLAAYEPNQIVVLGPDRHEYRVHADNAAAIAVERMF